MKSIRVIPAIAFAALLITSCVTMQKPVFKNTLWRGESQMFVADAGTLTDQTSSACGKTRGCSLPIPLPI